MAGPEAHPVPDSGTFRTNLSYELAPITYHPRTSRPFSNAQPGPYCIRYSPGTQSERCFGDGWIMTRLLLYSKEPLPAKGLESALRQAGGVRSAASMQYISRVKRGTGAPDAGPRTAGSWSGADLCRLERDAARDELEDCPLSELDLHRDGLSGHGVRDPGNSAQDAAAPTPGELSATSAGGRSVV